MLEDRTEPSVLDSVVIQGKRVSFRRAEIAISDCILDPANPRVQFLVGQRAEALSQQELREIIWQKDAVKNLATSIRQNGGVYESILVQQQGDKYLVREGNCRTVSLFYLEAEDPATAENFSKIPAMIFSEQITEEDVAVLLADMHVSGRIRWDAYEQAKHVSDLNTIYAKSYDWLSSHLRQSKGKIAEQLKAYEATKQYLERNPDPSNVKKFSFFQELMKKKELRERYAMDPDFKTSFNSWVEKGKLVDAKQARQLPAVLANPSALKALNEEGFEAATKVLIHNDPALESDLFSSVKKATDQLRKAPADEIGALKSGDNPQKLMMLRNLSRALEDLATLSNIKL